MGLGRVVTASIHISVFVPLAIPVLTVKLQLYVTTSLVKMMANVPTGQAVLKVYSR